MSLNAQIVTMDQEIVQRLVIGEVKTKLEQSRLQAPVGLRQEEEIRMR